MLLTYANNINITENVRFGSIRIVEQLNNRANTCSLTVDKSTIGEGAKIEVFEGFVLTAEALSGQAVLSVFETFPNEQKFKPGDEIILNIKDAEQQRKIIQSIDHNAKTITLTTNLTATVPQRSNCGRIVFSGITMKNPDEEIGMTGDFTYKITATDRTKIFDAKVVVESYVNQYSREAFGRMILEYCANDSEIVLDEFDSAWTASGLALSMTAETTDRISSGNSMKTGVSAAGTATRTKTISSVDLSGMEVFRLFHKLKEGIGNKVSSMKFRIGTDASNYYEGTSARIGQSNEDCWNYEAFRFDRASITGTPDKSDIQRLQIEVISNASIGAGNILFDYFISSSGGFTLNNSIRGDKKLEDVRVQYKKPTVFVEEISKLQNFFRFIDYERDFHFFKNTSTPAPFGLTDSSQNYSDLSITADISQLKNRQTVRGGEAIDETIYIQDEITDGKAESRRLDYKPKELEIWVDTTGTGSSFVQYSVGVENLVEPSSVDYLFNFNEKIVRKASATTPPAGSIFRRKYYPYKPIRVRVKNNDSITAMKALLGGDGIFDGAAINDASIRDWNEARARAKAEVDAYCNPILTATFETQVDGLQAGQIIHVTDSSRGIDQDFLIQRISKNSRKNELRTYSVECGSTMFGIIEFFQLLLKRSEKLMIDVSEVVDIVANVDETIKMIEFTSTTKKDKTFKAGTVLKKTFDFIAETSSATIPPTNQRQRKQTKTSNTNGTTGFGISNHSNGSEMFVDVDSYSGGASGQSLTIDQRNTFEAKASTQYTATARIENKITDGLVGGYGLTLAVEEIGVTSVVKYNNTYLNFDGVNNIAESVASYSGPGAGNLTAVGTTITEAGGLILHNGTSGSYFNAGQMPFNSRQVASYFVRRFKVNSLAAPNTIIGRNFSTYSLTTITVETDGKVQVEVQGTGSARIKANTTVLTAGVEYNIGVRVNNYLDPSTARATTDIDIFINGVKQTLSMTAIGNNTALSTNIFVGSYNTTISPLNGARGDILIYKKALTDAEMTGISQSPINEFIDNFEDCVRRRNGLYFWQPGTSTAVTGVDDIRNRKDYLFRNDLKAIFIEYALNADGTNTPLSQYTFGLPFCYFHIRNTTNLTQWRIDSNNAIIAGNQTIGTGNRGRHKALCIFWRETDNSKLRIYSDGSASGIATDPRIPNSAGVGAGKIQVGANANSNLRAKSLIVYKGRSTGIAGSGISTGDITRINNRQEPNSTPGLIKFVHYDMNKGSGTILEDISGNGRAATLSSGGDFWATDNSAPFALDREVFGVVATNNIEANLNTIQDFKRSAIATFTTAANTRFLNVKAIVNESTGKVGISDIIVEETASEPTTNPGSAGYAEAV